MSKENRVSDERLAEILTELVQALAQSAREETIVRSYHVKYARDALTELQSLRSKPAASVIHNDEAGFWEAVTADVPTVTEPTIAANVEFLHDLHDRERVVGFRVHDVSSKPVAGVEVKPLEWEEWGPSTNGINKRRISERGLTPFMAYFIEQDPDSDQWWLVEGLLGEDLAGPFAEVWQARAAAEADYRQRILSTLSLPAQEPARVEFDMDAPPDHSADNAADFILHELAKALKVDFRPAEGSETWEGDVLGTMWHALTDSGVIDEWDNSLRVSPKSAAAQEPVAWGVYLAGGRFMDIASDNRDDAVAMAEALHDPHEFVVKPLYLSPSVCEGKVTEAMRAEALRQLQLRDERDQRVHDIIEELREMIYEMPMEDRPAGLFQKAQDAVYGMRGRVRLMDDASLTAALKEA